jgi:hypothetical protein
MSPILQAILQEIVIPEVLAIFRRRAEAGQPMPTEAEIKAALVEQADKYIAAGKAFLALKGA